MIAAALLRAKFKAREAARKSAPIGSEVGRLMTFSVAIDGPSGAGKSTIARAVARRTGALYLDTGAMYRAVGLYALENGVDPSDARAVAGMAPGARVLVGYEGGLQRVYLGGRDVSDEIRSPQVSAAASQVSAVPQVRARMVEMQREIAKGHSVVMDGRDIGTCVLPGATLKIFLVADAAVRAARRFREMRSVGAGDTYEEVLQAILKRDHDDSTRAASPLKKADDAVELDASKLTADEAVREVLRLLEARVGAAALSGGERL
jgi:cytidylate kinase